MFTEGSAEIVAYLHDDTAWVGKFLGFIERKTGVLREHFSSVAFGIFAAYLVFGYFAQLICNIVGFAYPAYASMMAIESVDKKDDTQWLTYWTVFAVFSLIDFGADKICGWFPLYWLAKCVFLMYLYIPRFNGATKFYESNARPLIQFVYKYSAAGFRGAKEAAGGGGEGQRQPAGAGPAPQEGAVLEQQQVPKVPGRPGIVP